MKHTQLGISSLTISTISFGCMSLEEDQAKATSLLHKAIELGINYFDTADIYQSGRNEQYIGNALKAKRKQVIIASKVGNVPNANGGLEWNPRKDHILSSIDKSLQRLQTDYIDLYQLHGGTIDDPIDETIEAFEILKQQGKILYYGISSIRPNVIREWIKRSAMVSVMMQYSLLDRRPEEECLSLLQQNNIGVLARGSVAKGLLAGKPPASFLNYSAKQVETAAAAVKSISSDKRSPSQTALRFVLQNTAISSAVVGIRTLQQLEEAVGAIESPALNSEEINILSKAIPPNYYDVHR